MFRVGDLVRAVSKKKTKYKFYPAVGTTGRITKLYKTGVFVEWNCDPAKSCWCRYGEVKKYSDLDSFFDEFMICGGEHYGL